MLVLSSTNTPTTSNTSPVDTVDSAHMVSQRLVSNSNSSSTATMVRDAMSSTTNKACASSKPLKLKVQPTKKQPQPQPQPHKYQTEEIPLQQMTVPDGGNFVQQVQMVGAIARYQLKREDRATFWVNNSVNNSNNPHPKLPHNVDDGRRQSPPPPERDDSSRSLPGLSPGNQQSPNNNTEGNHHRQPSSSQQQRLHHSWNEESAAYAQQKQQQQQQQQQQHLYHRLLAFCGVFDGHSGATAAEYCSRGGLFTQVMLETEKSGVTMDLMSHQNHSDHVFPRKRGSVHHNNHNNNSHPSSPISPHSGHSTIMGKRPSLRNVLTKTRNLLLVSEPDVPPHVQKATQGLAPLPAAWVRAFYQTQEQFGNVNPGDDLPVFSLPPKWPPRANHHTFKRAQSLRHLIARPFHSNHHSNNPHHHSQEEFLIGGGTTACTLSLYSGGDSSSEVSAPGVYAVVANCGDSRLICDHGKPRDGFVQITRDHRPEDPGEAQRLKEYMRQPPEGAPCHVQHFASNKPPRIFPGGLAVSRSVGDLNFCQAVVPLPDVFCWRLDPPQLEEEERPVRFILASDGLFDVTTNEQVGEYASQLDKEGQRVSAQVAASRVMEHCLERGGFMDDVTIMVIDVTLL